MIVKKGLFFGLLISFFSIALPDQAHYLKNNKEALNFCRTTKDTYVVVVWPLGSTSLKYIVNALADFGEVKYVKSLTGTKADLFMLYRKLHKSMSYLSAHKYFKPYVPKKLSKPLLEISAIVLHTPKPLADIMALKKEIRAHIGHSYYSIHINEYYDPQTIEAAYALFNDF